MLKLLYYRLGEFFAPRAARLSLKGHPFLALMRSQKRWRASWTFLCNTATNLFLLRQLQHLHTPLEITCIPYISLNPYAHVISFYSSSILSWNLAGFAGARYDVDFVMTYGNVSPLYTIFLCKVYGSRERVRPPLLCDIIDKILCHTYILNSSI